MRFTLAAAIAALTLIPATVSTAAIENEAFGRLSISDFGVFTTSLGTEGKRPVTASDFASIAPSDSTSASAVLNGVGIATADGTQSFVGSGAVGEDDFTRQASGSAPFARGDTTASGFIIDGLGPPFGANVTTVAEVQLPLLANGDTGTSASNVGNTSEFTFAIGTTLDLILELTAEQLLVAELTSPPGFTTFASTNFGVTVTDDSTGLPVFLWAPNGTGSAIGATSVVDPFSLNTSVGETGVTGIDMIAEGPDFFTATATLGPGDYTLSINHGSDANAANLAIPEPVSALVWIGLPLVLGSSLSTRTRSRS